LSKKNANKGIFPVLSFYAYEYWTNNRFKFIIFRDFFGILVSSLSIDLHQGGDKLYDITMGGIKLAQIGQLV